MLTIRSAVLIVVLVCTVSTGYQGRSLVNSVATVYKTIFFTLCQVLP
jgi:phosphomevalonate kinase